MFLGEGLVVQYVLIAIQRVGQEECKFKVSLGYRTRPFLKHKQKDPQLLTNCL